MIILKANAQLKAVFGKLIKTAGENVEWKELFVVANNNLILLGKVRSLFLNFDNKKVFSNIVDMTVDEDAVELMDEKPEITNVINMVLYAFGKWGSIAGLKVEKDYAQLNALFRDILKIVQIDVSFRDDNFRFFQKGLQISYEEVVQKVLEHAKGNAKDMEHEEEKDEYKLGLWHNVSWNIETLSFQKSPRTARDKIKERLGKNFYMVDYQCPKCSEKIHMAVYPMDQELLIETEEAKVYLARAYACDGCNSFFTPRPGRLIQEGDIYRLYFDEDRKAYEDYLELLGKTGGRYTNYKFNEYANKRNQAEEPPTLDEVAENMDMVPYEMLKELMEKAEAGFYPWTEVAKHQSVMKDGLEKKQSLQKKQSLDKKQSLEKVERNPAITLESLQRHGEKKEALTLGDKKTGVSHEESNVRNDETSTSITAKDQYQAHFKVVERMSHKQLQDLRDRIQADTNLMDEDKRIYLNTLDQTMYKKEAEKFKERAEKCKEKGYQEIARAMEEIKMSTLPESMKKSFLEDLREWRRIRGEQEVREMLSNIPEFLNRKQHAVLLDKLKQYEGVDLKPYEAMLNERFDKAEKQEITSIINKFRKKDRNDLQLLKKHLQEQNYAAHNLDPFLKKVEDKLIEADQKEMERICPDIQQMSFEELMDAYKKINEGLFLPELKVNMLEMLKKRLTRMKLDENSQLIRKFQKELARKVSDISLFTYYEPKKDGSDSAKEYTTMDKAMDTYAAERVEYEFPIVEGGSKALLGEEGFVLTPERLFYKTMMKTAWIPILAIEKVSVKQGLLKKGIFLELYKGELQKLPNVVAPKEWEAFAEMLQEYITYLQEKPESRNVSYLAQEKHEVKCCYRCGFRFESGEVCPKCGSKANH